MTAHQYLPLDMAALARDAACMTTYEFGAYIKLIQAAWRSAHCDLPADQALLARYAGVRPRDWRKMADILLPLFKRVWRHGGWRLHHVSTRAAKAHVLRSSDLKYARLRRRKHTKCAKAASETPTRYPHIEANQLILADLPLNKNNSKDNSKDNSKKERTPSSEGARKKAGPPDKPAARAPTVNRGSRIDPDRKPSEADIAFARRHGHDDARIADMWEHFVAFHFAKGDTSKSWPHSWQTWVKNEKVYGHGPPMQRMAARRTRMDDVKELIAEGWLDHVED